jgi:hypothetical protein
LLLHDSPAASRSIRIAVAGKQPARPRNGNKRKNLKTAVNATMVIPGSDSDQSGTRAQANLRCESINFK